MSVLFVACGKATSSKGNDYWIDNPTSNEITVKIDEQEFIIPAESNVVANLSWGKHTMDYNGERINFFCKPGGNNVEQAQTFINPTQSNYVIYNQLFLVADNPRATEEFVNWFLRENRDSIIYYEGGKKQKDLLPFSVDNSLFVTKSNISWDLFLNEELPNDLLIRNPFVIKDNNEVVENNNLQGDRFQESKKKLFREKDFWAYCKIADSIDLRLATNQLKYNDYHPIHIKLSKINTVKGEKYQNYFRDLESKTNEWLSLTDSEKVVKLQEELFGVQSIIARTDMKSEYLSEYPNDFSFNEVMDEFTNQTIVKSKKAMVGIAIMDLFIVK